MKKLKCNECGTGMMITGVDRHSRSKYDNYWACTNCQTGCKQEICDGKPYKEHWYTSNNGSNIKYTKKVDSDK